MWGWVWIRAKSAQFRSHTCSSWVELVGWKGAEVADNTAHLDVECTKCLFIVNNWTQFLRNNGNVVIVKYRMHVWSTFLLNLKLNN